MKVLLILLFTLMLTVCPTYSKEKIKVWKETVRLQASLLPLDDGIRLAFTREDWETLKWLSNKKIKEEPDNSMGYFFKGVAVYELGNPKKSIKYYTKAIELRPEYGEHYQNRGLAYMVLRQYDSALTDYNKALELYPDDKYAIAQKEYLLNLMQKK